VKTNPFLPLKSELPAEPHRSNHFMRIIALGRLIYGIVLLGVGLAVFDLIGKNLTAEILKLITRWHIETHVYYVHWLLQKVSGINHGLLILLAFTNFFMPRWLLLKPAAFSWESAGLIGWSFWIQPRSFRSKHTNSARNSVGLT
jgi:hypothetical protein